MIAALVLLALAICIVGIAWRMMQYGFTPQHRHMPLTPAPFTRLGQGRRVLGELFLFRTLFRSSLYTWLFAWPFHLGLLWLLLFHINLFAQPGWAWLNLLASEVKFASLLTMLGLLGLLARRIVLPRVRFISAPSDYLWLVFLLCLVSSGFLMRWTEHNDIESVRHYFGSIINFVQSEFPSGYLLFSHLLLAAVLFVVLPFSKLLHAPGFFFSPSIMTREKKRVADKNEASAIDAKAGTDNV